jgi:hypothetical protein
VNKIGLLAGLASLLGIDMAKLIPEPLPKGYLSINPDRNRADRRRTFKLRGTPPDGVRGSNQRQRVLAWERKEKEKEAALLRIFRNLDSVSNATGV